MTNAGRTTGAPRVAFLIDRWQASRGGAEAALVGFASYLEQRGYEVHAIGLQGPLPGEASAGRFHAVRTSGLTRGRRERRLAEASLARAAELGADCTIGVRHLPRVDVYWPHGGSHAETLALLGKRAKGRHKTFVELERAALEGGAKGVVCVSESVREEFARRYPASAERLVVVPNGVDLETHHPRDRGSAGIRLAEQASTPVRVPRLTFVGRNAKLKGLDILLDALVPLRDRPWVLVAAGVGQVDRWRARARRLGIGDRTRIFDRLDGALLSAGSDLLVLPSRRDPCPLVVLEALAAGTPVLLSERVGARDAVLGADAGAVVGPLEDRAAWTAAIADRLDRLAQGLADPQVVREGVRERSREKWWKRLEQVVLETAELRAPEPHSS